MHDASDHPDTPPPDEARAQRHEWMAASDEAVAVALWTLVDLLTRREDGDEASRRSGRSASCTRWQAFSK